MSFERPGTYLADLKTFYRYEQKSLANIDAYVFPNLLRLKLVSQDELVLAL